MIEINKFKCHTCDGSGFLPHINGNKDDGGRRCPECNNEICQTCGGSGKVHSHNPKCWDCNGTGKVS